MSFETQLQDYLERSADAIEVPTAAPANAVDLADRHRRRRAVTTVTAAVLIGLAGAATLVGLLDGDDPVNQDVATAELIPMPPSTGPTLSWERIGSQDGNLVPQTWNGDAYVALEFDDDDSSVSIKRSVDGEDWDETDNVDAPGLASLVAARSGLYGLSFGDRTEGPLGNTVWGWNADGGNGQAIGWVPGEAQIVPLGDEVLIFSSDVAEPLSEADLEAGDGLVEKRQRHRVIRVFRVDGDGLVEMWSTEAELPDDRFYDASDSFVEINSSGDQVLVHRLLSAERADEGDTRDALEWRSVDGVNWTGPEIVQPGPDAGYQTPPGSPAAGGRIEILETRSFGSGETIDQVFGWSPDGERWGWSRSSEVFGRNRIGHFVVGDTTALAVVFDGSGSRSDRSDVYRAILPEAPPVDDEPGPADEQEVEDATGTEDDSTIQSDSDTEAGPTDLDSLADLTGASVIVEGPNSAFATDVADQESLIRIWSAGSVIEIHTPAGSWAWADDDFIYLSAGNDEGTGRFSVVDYDGTPACEFELQPGDWLHHATRAADGSVVLGIGNETDISAAWAVDCETGERTAIEPFGRRVGEVEYVTTVTAGTRRFHHYTDNEGNAYRIEDEAGRSILTDDDYAGLIAYDPTGTVIAYTEHRQSASPHVSVASEVRSVADGELIGAFTTPGIVCDLYLLSSERLAVYWGDDLGGVCGGTALTMFDLDSGDEVGTVQVGDPGLLHLG